MGIEFGGGGEERLRAASTQVGTGLAVVVEDARVRRFGGLFPQHFKL